MDRLTGPEHWDAIYLEGISAEKNPPNPQRDHHFLTSCVKSLLGRSIAGSYSSHLFWNILCPQYLPQGPGKVLEVGCAPGRKLVRFAQMFGYEPYGVDCSGPGVEISKQTLSENGFNPANIVQEDFFSEEFQQKYRGVFDVVVSLGFIEHFTDVEFVIAEHMYLLRDNGILVISIPNLRGINLILTYLLNREALKMHNLQIMDLRIFRSLFLRPELRPRFCGYYGGFYWGVCASGDGLKSRLAKICLYAQWAVDFMLMKCCKHRKCESRLTSPYLLYIGAKAGPVNS